MSSRTIATPTAIPPISPALILPLTGAFVGGLTDEVIGTTDGFEVAGSTDGVGVVWGGSVGA